MATKLKEHVIRGVHKRQENEPSKFFYVCAHLPKKPNEQVYQEFEVAQTPCETRMCDACYRERYVGCCGS